MIVECGHCGAPLDVKEGASIFKCRYCGMKNERQRARTIAEQTPADFKPPTKWTPPPEFPADSNKELKYKSGGMPCGCFVIAGAMILPIAIGFFSWCNDSTGLLETSPSKLAVASIGQNPKNLASALSGNDSSTSVYVKIHSARYKAVSFSYDEKFLDHPTSFTFITREDKDLDTSARDKLASLLRGGFDENGSWGWEGISITVSPGNVSASADTDDGKNPFWKRQLDAAWELVMNAVFGFDVAPSAAEMKELMGSGYPFAELAKISPAMTVDTAADTIRKGFPGAAIDTQSGVEAVIALDHPSFRSVKLRWQNSRGATLDGADFAPLDTRTFSKKGEAIATCLGKTLGAATAHDADYMRKTKYYDMRAGRLNFTILESGLNVHFYSSEKPDPASWTTLITSVKGCP